MYFPTRSKSYCHKSDVECHKSNSDTCKQQNINEKQEKIAVRNLVSDVISRIHVYIDFDLECIRFVISAIIWMNSNSNSTFIELNLH